MHLLRKIPGWRRLVGLTMGATTWLAPVAASAQAVPDAPPEPVHAEPPDDLDELARLEAELRKADVEANPILALERHQHHHVEDDVDDAPAPVGQRENGVEVSLSDAEIHRLVRTNLTALGPLSVGKPQQGKLVNAVKFPEGDQWTLVAPANAYATQETIDYLVAAIRTSDAEEKGEHPLYIGDISAKWGGHLGGHRSHQAGRDADLSYFFKEKIGKWQWYKRATAENLDIPKTWSFVRALLTETDAKFIFINTSVQKVLKEHALAIGEDPDWLDAVFQYDSKQPWPIIRHSPGHDTHIHVRFYNPRAQELGRRAYDQLVARGVIKPHVYYTTYVAKRGDMLSKIASRFKCEVAEIQKANKLHGSKILAGKAYRIPRKGNVHQLGPVKVPARRLPPKPGASTRSAQAAGR